MKKEWYAHFILFYILPISVVLLTGLLAPLIWSITKHNPNPNATQKSSEQIVVLSPNLTEIVFALGLGDKVVGVSSDSDWPVEAKQKPKMGTFWQPNTEAIIAAKPDLVICESFLQHKEVAETLKRAGLNVLSLHVESIEELYNAITQIGQATGCSDKAEQLAAKIKSELDQIRAKASSARKVKVLWAVQTEPMRVVGVKTFVNEIIDLAGGQNVIELTGDQYPSVGTETILTSGAEVIIQSAMGTEDIAKQQETAEKFWSKYANLPAVKDKKVYVLEADTVLRLGPRLPDGAMAVAKLLHLELFSQPKNLNKGDQTHK
ncbi:MAG: cobalamin-binding protein [Sedimentisphaerales bacterium]|jgi:iron complex transport system substrate-binding protein